MNEPSASTHLLDQGRDPLSTAHVQRLAAEIATHYGGELARMQRANGYSNATWVGDGIAVRIAHTPVDMAREVALVRSAALRDTYLAAKETKRTLISERRLPDLPRVVRGRADVLSSTSTSALWHHPQGGPQLVHQAPYGFRTTYQFEDVNFLAIDKAQDNHPDQGCACAGDPQPVVARRTHT